MALKKRRWILGSGCLFGINGFLFAVGEVRLEVGGACAGGGASASWWVQWRLVGAEVRKTPTQSV